MKVKIKRGNVAPAPNTTLVRLRKKKRAHPFFSRSKIWHE